ncbi:MAG: serine hydrolase domain-containing protein [Pseudomonadota bacterium]
MIALSGLAAATLTGAAWADDQTETVMRMEAAWTKWRNDVGGPSGVMLITRDGEPVKAVAAGVSVAEPMEMASLSKAITAMCVKSLVDDDLLGYDTTLGMVLGTRVASALADVTVAELLTHQAGFWPDSTQKSMPQWRGEAAPRHRSVTATVLARGAPSDRRGTYRYNNEHYAVLGEMIAGVTDRPYRDVCRDRVLPASRFPDVAVSADFGVFDAWGGWAMPVDRYARFFAEAFGAETDVGRSPSDHPSVDLGGGAYYGMGTFWRQSGSGHNHWMFGALCFDDAGHGSYAVSWNGGWGAVVAWRACLAFDEMIALDKALVAAVFRR